MIPIDDAINEETTERVITGSGAEPPVDDAIDEETTTRVPSKPKRDAPAAAASDTAERPPKPELTTTAKPAAESEPEPAPATEPEPTTVAKSTAEPRPATESEPEPATDPQPEPDTSVPERSGNWTPAAESAPSAFKRAAAVLAARAGTVARLARERSADLAERRIAAAAAREQQRVEARAAAGERATIAEPAAPAPVAPEAEATALREPTVEPAAEPAEATAPRESVADSEVTRAPARFELGPAPVGVEFVLEVAGLSKRFDDTVAVDALDLRVPAGALYGIVGPNGAGKTTTLSMITGLLRPDAGSITVHGADVWADPVAAKRSMGVLPDRLRLFDRLTGAQLLYYAGVLRGLDAPTVRTRMDDLARAFGFEDALTRMVSDYSSGMTKQVALAAALIHSPRLLVLDEPFESMDPVSAATVSGILQQYSAAGGTVVVSSHSMDLVQRLCDHVAVVVDGVILADGTMEAVRDGGTLEQRFVELAGGRTSVEGLAWLHSFSG